MIFINGNSGMGNLMKEYDELKSLVISERKDEFNEFMSWVENSTEYLKAPASTKYHLSVEQGLLQHSVSVAQTMIKLKNILCPDTITDEQCVIVGLLHDLGKVGYPGAPQYLKNYNDLYSAEYRYNKNILYMPHAHRSLYLIQLGGFKVTSDEFQAILIHDGQYVQENKSYALNECTLAKLLHIADFWSSQELESYDGML